MGDPTKEDNRRMEIEGEALEKDEDERRAPTTQVGQKKKRKQA